MKISILMLFIYIFTVTAENVYPQQKEISLNLKNTTILQAISQIEEMSDYVFLIMDEAKSELDQTININVNKKSIYHVLDALLKKTNLTYSVVEKQISLFKKEKENSKEIIVANDTIKQQKTIIVKGLVLDEAGNPLPGATITVVGSTRGVITDSNGAYSIEVKPTDELTFSFVGFESQTIKVDNRTAINVVLKEKTSELKEVEIVAFGKQKKESVVGAITTVTPKELKIPSSNLTTAFAGRLAGLISYQRSGEPGLDNAEFFIRGVTTFGYKKDPLILIDGNEVTSEDLARLQPDDIASFSIMKDATSTALYGSRGANGVILVKTKEGVEGKTHVNVRYEGSMSQPTKLVKLADPITYMRLHNEAVRTRNPLGITPYSQNKIDNTIAGVNPYVYPANDWYKILFKDYSLNQRLNFSVSGGGKVARYYLAGTLNYDNGMLKVDKKNNFNNNVKLNRYMLRSNVNINVTPTTEVVVRLSGTFDDYTGPIGGGSSIFQTAMNANPVLFPPYFKPDSANIYTRHILYGNYEDGQYNNPYAEMTKGYRNYSTSDMYAQFELNQNFDFITKGLSLRALFNTQRYGYFSVNRFYNPFYYTVGRYNKAKDEYTLNLINPLSGTEYLSYNEDATINTSSTYFETALDWNRIFAEKHELGALLVYTMREQLNSNAGDLQKSLPYRNIGLAGRATYGYNSRYFGEFNFGYNGSERFSKKERFGFFPSIGVGWLISNEKFWNTKLKNVVDNLKLKVTYGLVGNDAIGDANDRFFYLSNVNMNDPSRSSAFGTYGNVGGYSLNGISVSRYPNDAITWETAKKFDLGLELGVWNSLEIQADVFKEDRSNILMTRASIPTTMGLEASIRANVGEATSKGVDIAANYSHFFNKDTWLSGMGNFTYATSAYKVYEEPDYSATPWRFHKGYSLNQIWGYVAERLFVDEAEVKNSPKQFGDYMGGDIKYKDINKDGKITELDRVPIGYPYIPEIVYGFGISCGHKAFDLSCFFQGVGRESFWINAETTSPFIGGQRALLKAYADDHWSEDNRNIYALWPRLSPTLVDNNLQQSTWFMRDGSFLRLKSLEAGYSLPKKIISPIKLTSCRIYFSGTNLLTFSKFKLWDPEMGGNGLGYPIQKVYNLGIQVAF